MTDNRPATTDEVLKMLAALKEQVTVEAKQAIVKKMSQELVLWAFKRDIYKQPSTKQEGR